MLALMAPPYLRQLNLQLQRPTGVPSKPKPPECEEIELSGKLHRSSKWNPTLELIPPGRCGSFDLHGELLKDVPVGAYIRVKGVVRSHLHAGATEDNPSAFPPQWIIGVEVTELETLDDPMVMLERKRRRE